MLDCHAFALWCAEPLPASVQEGEEVVVTEPDVVARVRRVLRLRPKDPLILFDAKHRVAGYVASVTPQAVAMKVLESQVIAAPWPAIHLICPMLERPALSEAIRRATVMGVASITLVGMEKCHRKTVSAEELDRLVRVQQAAAEQSKQCFIAPIRLAQSLQEVSDRAHDAILMFDAEGKSLEDYCRSENTGRHDQGLTCVFGPEGGFTKYDIAALTTMGAVSVRLEPSILRSEDAVLVGLGVLRALCASDRPLLKLVDCCTFVGKQQWSSNEIRNGKELVCEPIS